MELFEQLRREYEFGVGTIHGVARKFGVHRRLARDTAAQALRSPHKTPQRQRPKLAIAIPFIDAILATDRQAPRKQRHTARWIFHRLQAELRACTATESTVREYVQSSENSSGERQRGDGGGKELERG